MKSILSIELRRLETKLADLLENESKKTEPSPTNATSAANGAPRTYDMNVKNYCKLQVCFFKKKESVITFLFYSLGSIRQVCQSLHHRIERRQ